ncbi:hypothetical protein GbCGDNIH6_8250 [Granulibacter bethesdensis]|nr:hypothetical protein GbCGDNIH6_8250 [Granulibacter bethesdensis]
MLLHILNTAIEISGQSSVYDRRAFREEMSVALNSLNQVFSH